MPKKPGKAKASRKRKAPVADANSKADDGPAKKSKKQPAKAKGTAAKRKRTSNTKNDTEERQTRSKGRQSSEHCTVAEVAASSSVLARVQAQQAFQPPGLENPSEVCYSNSAMQALMSLTAFREICANLCGKRQKNPVEKQLLKFYQRGRDSGPF